MTNFNLNELTLDNVGQWPVFVRYLVSAVLALILIAIAFWIFIKPKIDEYDALVTQEQVLRTDFENKQRQAASLKQYVAQLKEMKERFNAMLKELPAEDKMPGLLEDISKTGIASGLVFELFAPQPEVVHDFYIELPINMTVVGNYHQLAVFISRIVEMSRIVTLHDFVITVQASDKQKTNLGDLLEMKIMAKIYRYKS